MNMTYNASDVLFLIYTLQVYARFGSRQEGRHRRIASRQLASTHRRQSAHANNVETDRLKNAPPFQLFFIISLPN